MAQAFPQTSQQFYYYQKSTLQPQPSPNVSFTASGQVLPASASPVRPLKYYYEKDEEKRTQAKRSYTNLSELPYTHELQIKDAREFPPQRPASSLRGTSRADSDYEFAREDNTPRIRGRTQIRTLAVFEIIISIYMFASSAAAMAMTVQRREPWYLTPVSLDATGLWCSVFGFLCGAYGFSVPSAPKDQYRIVATLVLASFSAFGFGIQVIMCSIWTHVLAKQEKGTPGYYRGQFDELGIVKAILSLNAINIFVAFAAMILFAVTASYMCRNAACCCGEPIPVVMPSYGSEPIRTVYVEECTDAHGHRYNRPVKEVILVPVGPGSQQLHVVHERRPLEALEFPRGRYD